MDQNMYNGINLNDFEDVKRNVSKINWGFISAYQKLSEEFIREFKGSVNWEYVSESQKLSEEFIREFKDNVDWVWISRYQKLSEEFIREFKGSVNWGFISAYQKLSEEFIREFNLYIDPVNWLYKSTDFKKQAVMDIGIYECYDNHFIGYKGIRSDNYSKYNFQYQYEFGNTYTCHADHTSEENSFGLSVWDLENAKDYCHEKVVKVKVYYEDIARVVHQGNKIRCSKLEVLDEVK